jgi:hypothetical protein
VAALLHLSSTSGLVYRFSSYPQKLQTEFEVQMDAIAQSLHQPMLPFHPKGV